MLVVSLRFLIPINSVISQCDDFHVVNDKPRLRPGVLPVGEVLPEVEDGLPSRVVPGLNPAAAGVRVVAELADTTRSHAKG